MILIIYLDISKKLKIQNGMEKWERVNPGMISK
jgi:hypothetical protein